MATPWMDSDPEPENTDPRSVGLLHEERQTARVSEQVSSISAFVLNNASSLLCTSGNVNGTISGVEFIGTWMTQAIYL